MGEFTLDHRIKSTSLPIKSVANFEVRLVNDSRFLWLLLIPQSAAVTELRDLAQNERHQLIDIAAQIADIVQAKTNADKMNIATIGNIVPQLHLHIIARHKDDAAWPNPVWGDDAQRPYDDQSAQDITQNIKNWLSVITD